MKIIYGQSLVSLLSTNIHTPDDHSEEKNRLKFLKPKAKSLIKTAVKIAPHQTATDLLRNVQESPTKRINNDLKKSVARAIRKERVQANKVTLGGIELDNTLGTLRQITDVFWFKTALKEHRSGIRGLARGHCLVHNATDKIYLWSSTFGYLRAARGCLPNNPKGYK